MAGGEDEAIDGKVDDKEKGNGNYTGYGVRKGKEDKERDIIPRVVSLTGIGTSIFSLFSVTIHVVIFDDTDSFISISNIE